MKQYIYDKYLVKASVLQRDSFICQNVLCDTPQSPLTIHHIRFQKNGGEWKLRNCVTLCRACHKGYHNGKKQIKLMDREDLPSHVRGHTFKLNLQEEINWKEYRKIAKEIRKNNRHFHGLGIDVNLIITLMQWLYIPYYEMNDE